MSEYEDALNAHRDLPELLRELRNLRRCDDKFNLQVFTDDHNGDLSVILQPYKTSIEGSIPGFPSVAAMDLLARAIIDMCPEILGRAVSIAQKSVDKSLLSVEQVAVELLRHIEQIKQND